MTNTNCCEYGIKTPDDGQQVCLKHAEFFSKIMGKSVPLQAWSGPEGSRKLRFQNFMTTAQEGGKVVSIMHRPHLPPRKSWYSFLLEAE